MSSKIFQDKVFPLPVSEIMNLMHMAVFHATDGDEHWPAYLQPRQKEYVALGLAQYYQCEHCIRHHLAALSGLESHSLTSLSQNVHSMILFLRIDSRAISSEEVEHWTRAWQRFAGKIATETGDPAVAQLIGLAIGMARNDDHLIQVCGRALKDILTGQAVDPVAAIGELEAVVIFMKAAVSKNRIVDKMARLIGDDD